MNGRLMETLEILEEKIESIKWLLTTSSLKRTDVSHILNAIRKSAGILDKNVSRGTVLENRMRRDWRFS